VWRYGPSVNVFAAAVSEAGAGAARRLLSAELVAANVTGGHIGTRLQQQVAALPGVAAATTVPTAPVEIDGEQETAAAVVPGALGTLLTPDLRHGRAEDLAAGMFVEDDLARRHGWSLGAAVRVSSHQGRPLTLTITGIYRDASTPLAGGLGLPALLVSDTVAAQHFPPEATGDALLVAATPDADRAALRRDLEAAVADRPDVQVLTTTD
jgi:putative ABC transport system permease protein